MEILYFALGVLTVLFILGVVGTVWAYRKLNTNSQSIRDAWEALDSHSRDIEIKLNDLREFADREVKNMFDHSDHINTTLNRELDEINKSLDSRLDKFENRLKKIFEEGCKPVQEK